MHILLLPSWYPKSPADVNGVFFRDQALALSAMGHKVGVICPFERSLRHFFSRDSQADVLAYESDQGVETYRRQFWGVLPRIPFGKYVLFRKNARKLLREYISRNGKPDLIHAHVAVPGGAAAVDLGEEFSIPVVLTEHSSGYVRAAFKGWELSLARRAVSKANLRIAVSPALASLMEDSFPASKGGWHWVPNVVAERFSFSGESKSSHGRFRILSIAVMTANKGQIDLVRAFGAVLRSGLDAELWLVGDGPARNSLQEEVDRQGIGDRVKFIGLVSPDKVPDLMQNADIMVVSSHYETFGVVAAEALVMGVPVVATRCGGPECIVSTGDGALVPVGDPDAMAAAILDIEQHLSDYDRKTIATNARSRFSAEAVATALTKRYENVVSGLA